MKIRLALATLALLFAAACGAQQSGSNSTPTPTPVPTVGIAAATPGGGGATLTLSPGGVPANLPFPFTPGQPIPAIVRDVVVAAATVNIDALTALAKPQQVGCTTAQGAGGPPKCKPGEAAGTVTSMFPTGRCEGEWTADPKAAITALMAQPVLLYAAVEVKGPTPDPEPFWPKGKYTVMLTTSGGNPPGIYFILDDSNIVRAHALCGAGAGAETNVLRQIGTTAFLIPPGR